MKSVTRAGLVASVILAFSSPQAIAETRIALPVEAVDGASLELRGVGASRDDDGLSVSGWVGLKTGRIIFSPAHLHIEALDAAGDVRQNNRSALAGADI
jgi:hypothetical protein